jgi:hypothetical protein
MNESKFKNDNGQYYLRGLFFETQAADKSSVVYTLKEQDHQGFPSLYRLFMEENDPTEYRFATKHLGGWSHWEALTECTWFKPYVEAWRKELDVRMKSQALSRIMSEAKTGGRDAFASNKYLLEKGWEKEPPSKRGRPTKAEIKEAAFEVNRTANRLEEDFFRISGKTN